MRDWTGPGIGRHQSPFARHQATELPGPGYDWTGPGTGQRQPPAARYQAIQLPGPGNDWTGPGTGHQASYIGARSPVTSHRSYHLPGIGDRPIPDFYPEMGYGAVRDGTYDTGCYEHPQSVMPTTRGVQSHRDFQTPGLNDTRTFREESYYGPQDTEYWRTYTPGDGRMSIRPGVPPLSGVHLQHSLRLALTGGVGYHILPGVLTPTHVNALMRQHLQSPYLSSHLLRALPLTVRARAPVRLPNQKISLQTYLETMSRTTIN